MEELIGALLSRDKNRNRLLRPTEDGQEDKASARRAAAGVINKETLQSWRFCHLSFKKEQIAALEVFFSREEFSLHSSLTLARIFFS